MGGNVYYFNEYSEILFGFCNMIDLFYDLIIYNYKDIINKRPSMLVQHPLDKVKVSFLFSFFLFFFFR